MGSPRYASSMLIGAAAVLLFGSQLIPGGQQSGPVLTAAVAFVAPKPAQPAVGVGLASKVASAVATLGASVRQLSHPKALDNAFRAYYAYKTEHPTDVKKPYLYFVDYGLSNTTPRGYVFD